MTTTVLYKDENFLWSGFYCNRSRHGNITPLRFLFIFVFLCTMSRDVHRLGSHCYLWHKPIISIFRIFLPKVIESYFDANLFLFAKCARAYRTWKQCQWIMRTLPCKYKTWGENWLYLRPYLKARTLRQSLSVAPYWRAPKKDETAVYGYDHAPFLVLLLSCWCLVKLIFT